MEATTYPPPPGVVRAGRLLLSHASIARVGLGLAARHSTQGYYAQVARRELRDEKKKEKVPKEKKGHRIPLGRRQF